MIAIDPPCLEDGLGSSPTLASADPLAPPSILSVRAFLDEVATVLRQGLPQRVWIEATILTVKPGRYGHTIELADAHPAGHTPAHLRAFLPTAVREEIGRSFGFELDPVLLVGMTTTLLIAPDFSPTWHLSARILALSRSVEPSLRRERLKRAIASLKRDGLFDRQRALSPPTDITRITVLHPPGSAGWSDMAGELKRWQAAGLIVVRTIGVPFEGERAAQGLVAALAKAILPIDGSAPDLVILARGGGARAGLIVFDDEALAAAICRCPVPMVAGIGHAVDTSLACLCAWRRVDTPSKAVALVASIMAAAARSALTDHSAIETHVGQQLNVAIQALLGSWQRVETGLERRLAAGNQALAAVWATVRIGATAARERTATLAEAALHGLRAVLSEASAAIRRHVPELDRTFSASLDHAARTVGRHDGGAAYLGTCGTAAMTSLDRQATGLAHLWDGLRRDLGQILDQTGTALTQAALVMDGHDPSHILARGFVLVTDRAGRVLPTRLAAMAHDRVRLLFGDGDLPARPEPGSEDNATNGD